MILLLRFACFAALLVTIEFASVSIVLARATADAIDQAVNAELERQQIVGAAIGVIEDGRFVYVQGYGLADRDKGIPVDRETVFNWASNSKPLMAVAAMQLVQKKLLDLDADIRTYVPEFPDKGVKITTRHLLCHQSGLPHYSNGTIVPGNRLRGHSASLVEPVASLDRFSGSPLLFDPGSKVSYSSYAYILLSAVVERAGEEPMLSQIQSRISKRAGIKSLQLDSATKANMNNLNAARLVDQHRLRNPRHAIKLAD